MIPKPVSAESAKPAAQQLWEMVNWGSRLVTTPNEYRTYRLFLRGRTKKDALRYLSGPRAASVLEQMNPEPEILEDKLRYNSHFGGLGLPIPETLAVVGAHPHTGDMRVLESAEAVEAYLVSELGRGEQLVVKQLDGMQGTGVAVLTGLRRDGAAAWAVHSNGEGRSVPDLARELACSGTVWLVQRRLKQHHTLDSLNATSVNTTRLATLRRRDGTVDIAYAVLRIGRAAGQVDGYSAGGIVVRVNPATGRLAPQGQQKYSLGLLDRHPDSGVAFGDVTMPHWDETLTLARQFAAAAGENRFIGWDVAMTPDGPVFIEGNHNWDVHLAQIGSDGLLSDNEMVNRLRSEAGFDFDTARLPRPRPLRAFRMLRSSH